MDADAGNPAGTGKRNWTLPSIPITCSTMRKMRELRLGLEAGLDVSPYRSLVYSATDMKEKRLAQINQKKSNTPSQPENSKKPEKANGKKINLLTH